MAEVDLAVIGAGLAGCSLIGRLQQLGSDLNIALIEAGRGPGGRTATRRRRDQSSWLLNHGAPGFNLSESMPGGMDSLKLNPGAPWLSSQPLWSRLLRVAVRPPGPRPASTTAMLRSDPSCWSLPIRLQPASPAPITARSTLATFAESSAADHIQ